MRYDPASTSSDTDTDTDTDDYRLFDSYLLNNLPT